MIDALFDVLCTVTFIAALVAAIALISSLPCMRVLNDKLFPEGGEKE